MCLNSNETSRNLPNRFVTFNSGIVRDKNTGLDWIARRNKDTNWYEAKNWVKELHVKGG